MDYFNKLFESADATVEDDVIYSTLDIRRWIPSGVQKICDVERVTSGRWVYKNQNPIMWQDHRSWIYFLVSGREIHKLGESGQPLAIKQKQRSQPISGTTNRLGRLANMITAKGDDTDERLRTELALAADQGQVSIWAFKVPVFEQTLCLDDESIKLSSCFHKTLEKLWLDRIKQEAGRYPLGNSGRA